MNAYKQPTEEEINEAAENMYMGEQYCDLEGKGVHPYDIGFQLASSYFKNYQTQWMENPVEQIMSNIDKLIKSGVESAAIKYAKPTDQLPTDEDVETIKDAFIAGANWQSSQPNPAIAVIEAKISELSKEDGAEHWRDKIILLETILKQIKP